MRILFSQLKKYLPDLQLSAHEVGEIYTMIGFMMDEFKEVEYDGQKDILLGLEVRQNRPDVVAIYGLVKELAAYLDIPYKIPQYNFDTVVNKDLAIKVRSQSGVKRVMAIGMKNITNKQSPQWMQEFLSFYDINSINLIVDISNYVMILTNQPSHIFDADKISTVLTWNLTTKEEKLTTLDGTQLSLSDGFIVIQDGDRPIALAGIVGGDKARVTEDTKNIIIETAIYDRSIVQRNARALSITTEASKRLEKILDPRVLPETLDELIHLVILECGGEITTKVYDYYPEEEAVLKIQFDPKECSIYAGIFIDENKAIQILERLSCIVESIDGKTFVTPPANRLDLELKEDLIEEVIRIVGFYTIPTNEVPALPIVKKITPKIVELDDKIKDIISTVGYDEVLSLPMISIENNKKQNYENWEMIITQNAVNDEFPTLRQSLTVGLLQQLDVYNKNNISHIKIFEIGKVFGVKEGYYEEHESFGMLYQDDSKNGGLVQFKNDIETVLRLIGLTHISYKEKINSIGFANKYATWEIKSHEQSIGIFYKTKPIEPKKNAYFAEINITSVLSILEVETTQSVLEISHKLITLDTNITLSSQDNIFTYVEALEEKIDKDYLWSLEVIDSYMKEDTIKYTIRVTYFNLSDTDAKAYDEKVFGILQSKK